MKRTLSLLLATLMIISSAVICIPATVSAAPMYAGSGSGTVATEEEAQAVEDATGYTQLPIGGWVTPDNSKTHDYMVGVYSKLKSAGLNYMVTADEMYSFNHTSKSMGAAYEVGLDMYLNTIYTNESYENEDMQFILERFKSFPNLKGFWFGDEPAKSVLPSYTSNANKLMAAMNNADFSYGGNMFPNSVTFGNYEAYLNEYASNTQKYDGQGKKIEALSTDFICFDHYVYGSSGDGIPSLIENLSQVKKVADANDIDMYSYVQTAGWDGLRQPSGTELLYNMHINLAFGAKSLLHFVAYQTGKYNGIVNNDGTYGPTYESAKFADESVDGFKGVYLSFDNDGFISVGDSSTVSKVNAVHPEYIHTSYKQLTSVEASKAFVGCFTKGEGADEQTGLYVVNQKYNTNDNSSVTLNLNGTVSYQIWGTNGLEQMGTDSKLVLDIAPGDAKFVILNSVNDASKYAPIVPEEKNDFYHAHQSNLVFDLGFDGDGNIYNEIDNGVRVMDDSYGTVINLLGKRALSAYSFQTEYTRHMCSENGVIVELNLMFTGNQNDNVFRDAISNFNFYRWEKNGEIWMGLPGGDDVSRNVTAEEIASMFPKNQWLHIVVTQMPGFQAMYVNGVKVLVGGYNSYKGFPASSLLFESSESVKLSDVKIYTCGANEKQAKMLYKDYLGQPSGALDGFSDLVSGAWYRNALETVTRRNLFGGISDSEFAPDADMTRSMFVTVLARLNGVNLDNYNPSSESPFTDVAEDQWFYKAVMWAYENGLVNGMTADNFGPDGKITREQMCVLMLRFANSYGYDMGETTAPVTFDDESSIGSWAIDAVNICQKAGLVTGMTATTFVPGGNASRAQVATIFTRLMAK